MQGTVNELENYIPWEILHKLINIDYHNRSLCGNDIFTIRDGDDLKRYKVTSVISRILDEIGMHHETIRQDWVDDIIEATR